MKKTSWTLNTFSFKELIREIFIAFLILTVFAFFLFRTKGLIPFDNDGHCDPWTYYGYFFLGDQHATIGPTRVDFRLPTIFLGFFLGKFFHTSVFDYLNFLILYIVSSIGVYLSARLLFKREAALIGMTFFATSGIVIGTLSTTYTGPSILYSILAISFAIASSVMPTYRFALLMISGAFWGTAIHAHLYSLTYNFILPLYAVQYFRLNIKSPLTILKDLVMILVFMIVGIILATAFWGALNVLFLHGPFLFFIGQFKLAFNILISAYHIPDWFINREIGAWLLLGVGLSTGIIFWLSRHRWSPNIHSQFYTALVPIVILEVAQLTYNMMGGVTLQYDYYYIWFLTPLAILLAAVVQTSTTNPNLALIFSVFFAFACILSTLHTHIVLQPTSTYPALLFALLGGLVALTFTINSKGNFTLPIFLSLLVLMGSVIRPERMGINVWSLPKVNGAVTYDRIHSGIQFLANFHFPKRPKFWISVDSKYQMWETIAYPRMYMYCPVDSLLPKFVPKASPDWSDSMAFEANDFLVMVAPNEAQNTEAKANMLHTFNLKVKELQRSWISKNGVSYLITINFLSRAKESS